MQHVGVSVAYAAYHTVGPCLQGRWSGALVAIKVIDAVPSPDASAVENARESLLAASVSHPNVVRP